MARGIEISQSQALGMLHAVEPPELAWLVRVAVPFDWAASKNHIYALRSGAGHVTLRAESSSYRDLITWKIKAALRDHRVAHNKIWIDIFVQKPNHRGDAVNVVDLVCDAVKTAVGVDDRWFSIRSVDWEIVKENPQIFVGVGQENVGDALACSSCGRVLLLAEFPRDRNGPLGVRRNCRDCTKARKRPSKSKSQIDMIPDEALAPARQVCAA